MREERGDRLAAPPRDRRRGRRADEPAQHGAGQGRGRATPRTTRGRSATGRCRRPAAAPSIASASGRCLAATSTANASSNATASPPSSNRRRPASRAESAAASSSSVGAVSSKPKLEPGRRCAPARSSSPGPRPTRSAPCRAAAAPPSRSCGRRRAAPASGRVRRRRWPARAAARRPVVAADLLDECRFAEGPARDRVAEQRRRAQVALADRDEPQAGHVRDRPPAPDDEHLAVLRPADPRQAARAEVHPAAEAVHRAEAEQRPAELVLPVERRAGRALREYALELPAHALCRASRTARPVPDAVPVDANRPHLGRQLADLARDLAVLGGVVPASTAASIAAAAASPSTTSTSGPPLRRSRTPRARTETRARA